MEDQSPNLASTVELCRVLSRAWEILRTGEAQLPVPENVVLLPFPSGRAHKKLGHFAPSRWLLREGDVHEVAIHPGLFHTPEDLLLVLLHEAAHGLLREAGFGCSSDGYYHRKEFRNQCISMGLDCAFGGTRHGWNQTQWTQEGVPPHYREALETVRVQLSLLTVRPTAVPKTKGVALPPSGRLRLVCRCPRLIYVSRGTAETGGIRCDFCRELFAIDILSNPESARHDA